MRLVRAELDQRMDRIKQLHQQTAQAFRDKLRARGLWISDQDAVIDSYNRSYALPAQFNARLAQLAQEAAQRHYKARPTPCRSAMWQWTWPSSRWSTGRRSWTCWATW